MATILWEFQPKALGAVTEIPRILKPPQQDGNPSSTVSFKTSYNRYGLRFVNPPGLFPLTDRDFRLTQTHGIHYPPLLRKMNTSFAINLGPGGLPCQ
jgi:hypothetical protein